MFPPLSAHCAGKRNFAEFNGIYAIQQSAEKQGGAA